MKIEIELTDYQVKIMKDMVIDINAWFQKGPFLEKISNHEQRIITKMRQKFSSEGKPLPANEKDLIETYFSLPDYKTRKEKEEAQAIEDLKRLKRIS